MPDISKKSIPNPNNSELDKHILRDLGLQPDDFGLALAMVRYHCVPYSLKIFQTNFSQLDLTLENSSSLQNLTSENLSSLQTLRDKWKKIGYKYPQINNEIKKLFKLSRSKKLFPEKFAELLALKEKIDTQLTIQVDQTTLLTNGVQIAFKQLKKFLASLVHPAALLRNIQTNQLKQVISDFVKKQEAIKSFLIQAPEVATALDKVLNLYKYALENWEKADAERRVQIRAYRAQLTTDSLGGFYELANNRAREIASLNIFGHSQQENETGAHAVKAVKTREGYPGSHWKANEIGGRNPIAPGQELAMQFWYQLFSPTENTQPLTPAIALGKITVMCVDKEKSPPEAVREFEEKLILGKTPEIILQQYPELDKKLTKKYIERVVQISKTMGDMSLHTLLALRGYFIWIQDKLKEHGQESSFFEKLPSLINGDFINDFKNKNPQWLEATDADLLCEFIRLMKTQGKYFAGYSADEIQHIDLNKLSSHSLDASLQTKFKYDIEKTSPDKVLSCLALITQWPALINQQSFYDLGRFIKTFEYLPKLFPNKSHFEYYNELKNILNYVDLTVFSAHFLAKLFSGPTDDKADNSMINIEYDAQGNIQCIKPICIDNDEAQCDSVTLVGNHHHPGVKNIFNFFPSMELPLDQKVVDHFLSQSPEAILLQWLVALIGQNRRYKYAFHTAMLIHSDLTDETDDSCLDIPPNLDPAFVNLMFYKIQKAQAKLKEDKVTSIQTTARTLFQLLDPVLEKFYKATQDKFGDDPRKCVGSIYRNPVSIEELLANKLDESISLLLPNQEGQYTLAEALTFYKNNECKEQRRTTTIEEVTETFLNKLQFPDCLNEETIVLSLLHLISFDSLFIPVLQIKDISPDRLIKSLSFPNRLHNPSVLRVLTDLFYLQPQLIQSFPYSSAWLKQDETLISPLLRIISYSESSYLPQGLLSDLMEKLNNGSVERFALFEFIARQPDLIHLINAPLENLLLCAAQFDNADAVRVLLNAGADANVTDQQYGWTALHYAVWQEQPSFAVIEALLQHPNRKANQPDLKGFTPIFHIRNPTNDLLDLLERYGEKLDYEAKIKETSGTEVTCRPIDRAMDSTNPHYPLFLTLARRLNVVKQASPKKTLEFVDNCIRRSTEIDKPVFQSARDSLIALNPIIKRLSLFNKFTSAIDVQNQTNITNGQNQVNIWMVGVHTGQHIFNRPEVYSQIFTQSGDLAPKTNKTGKCHVISIIENKIPIAWIKFDPQKLEEPAVLLSKRLGTIGDCVVHSEFVCIYHNKTKHFATISEHVTGRSLFNIHANIQDLDKLNKQIALDPAHFTKLVLVSVLFGLADGKTDNCIVTPEGQIKLIDVDRFLAEQLVINKEGKQQVNVVSAIYVLSQMLKPLDLEVCKEFLNLDPNQILQDWLKDLGHVSTAVNSFASETEIIALQTKDCDLTIKFSERQVYELVNRFKNIQSALRESFEITGMQLLRAVTPPVAVLIENTFSVYPSPTDMKQRFFHAYPWYETTMEVGSNQAQLMTEKNNESAKKNSATRQAMLKTTTAISQEKLDKEPKLDLEVLTNKLVSTQIQEDAILESIVKILSGDIETFTKASNALFKKAVFERLTAIRLLDQLETMIALSTITNLDLTSLGSDIKILVLNNSKDIKGKTLSDDLKRKLNITIFASLDSKTKKLLLQGLKNTPLTSLIIPNCDSLIDDELATILEGSSGCLRYLDISGCTKLTKKTLKYIEQFCPDLDKLFIRNLPWKKIELNLLNLRRLDASGCQVNTVKIIAPLQSLMLEATPAENIELIGSKLQGLSLVDSHDLDSQDVELIIRKSPELLSNPSLLLFDEKSPLILPISTLVRYATYYGLEIWTKKFAEAIWKNPSVNFLGTGIIDTVFRILLEFMPLDVKHISLAGTRVSSWVMPPKISKIATTNYGQLSSRQQEQKTQIDIGSKNKIIAIEVNHNGKLLIATKRDIQVLEKGKPSFLIKNKEDKDISAFAVSINGKLVTATLGAIHLFTLTKGKYQRLFDLTGYSKSITGLHIFADGVLVSVSQDGTIRSYNSNLDDENSFNKSGKILYTAKSPINVLTVLTNHQFLVGCGNGTLIMGDMNNWMCSEPIQIDKSYTSAITAIARIMTDIVAIGGFESRPHNNKTYFIVTLFNLKTKNILLQINAHEDRISCIEMLTEGQHFATGSKNGEAKIWDMMTGECIQTFPGDKVPVQGIKAIGLNQLAVIKEDGRICEYKVVKKEIIQQQSSPPVFIPQEPAFFSPSPSPSSLSLSTSTASSTSNISIGDPDEFPFDEIVSSPSSPGSLASSSSSDTLSEKSINNKDLSPPISPFFERKEPEKKEAQQEEQKRRPRSGWVKAPPPSSIPPYLPTNSQ